MLETPSEDYRFDPIAYEKEEMARPDEMAMLNRLGEQSSIMLDTIENANVLDLCCGTGLSIQHILHHKNVRRIVGVDNCPEYLDFAKSKYKNQKNIDLILHDAVTVNLHPKQWDLIVLSSAYHHIADSEKLIFLKNVKELLSDRGVAIVAENILPDYQTGDHKSYTESVQFFYSEVLKTAKEENPELPLYIQNLIWKVAEYGFSGDYEYKTSYSIFFSYLEEANLKILWQERVWPLKGPLAETTGGNYIFKIR